MSPADLKVSSCGRFAALINSAGRFFVVWAKDYAEFMIEGGIELKVITLEDAKVLRRKVKASSLPETSEKVDKDLCLAITLCNEAYWDAQQSGHESYSEANHQRTISVLLARVRANRN